MAKGRLNERSGRFRDGCVSGDYWWNTVKMAARFATQHHLIGFRFILIFASLEIKCL